MNYNMKTTQEKATKIIDKHYWLFGDGYLGKQHIQHALLEVDEILIALEYLDDDSIDFFREVKTIITNY